MGSKRTWIEKMPDSSLELCEKNLDLFFKTMFERQEIWYKRFILKNYGKQLFLKVKNQKRI